MARLIFVRHGETAKNASGKMHNFGDPEKLTSVGRTQIKLTAEKLEKLNIDLIYATKEFRAQESAEIVAKICKVPLKTIDGLEERNWGEFSDKTWPEVNEILSKMSLEERYNFVPSGGESWQTFEKRLIDAVKFALHEQQGKTIAILTHGGTIRVLMPFLLNNLPKEESLKYDIANASVSIFEYSDRKFKTIKINDTSHLR